MIRLLLVGFLVLLPAAAPARAVERPVVLTRFEIAVDEIERGLGAAVEEIEQRLSCELAARLQENLGYLDWLPDGPVSSSKEVVGRLDLRLVRIPLVEPWARLDVVFEGVADRRRVELPGNIFSRTLYDVYDEKPTRPPHADGLRQRLLALGNELFVTSDFLESLEVHFLQSVPIARELEPLVADQVLILPLTARQLRAKYETLLQAELQVRRPEWPAAKDGHLGLYKRGVCRVPGFEGRVETGVSRFELGPLSTTGWHAEIVPAVRDYRVPKSLRVFMLDYRPDFSDDGDEQEGVPTLEPEPWEMLRCQE